MSDTTVCFPVLLNINQIPKSKLGLVELKPNQGELLIPDNEKKDEIAPLVSAETYEVTHEDGKITRHLRVRMSIFTENTCVSEPIIGHINDYTCFFIQSKTPTPTATDLATYYKIWYFHFDIEIPFFVNQITVFNNLKDPKTSRGTVTTVQSTTPPMPPL